MIKNIKNFIKIFEAALAIIIFNSSCLGLESFKVGFEFQEISHVFPWAKDRPSLQKKRLFTILKGDNSLFHCEIDGEDIEFVTRPFVVHDEDSYKSELQNLRSSLKGVTMLTDIMTTVPESMERVISLQEFVDRFEKHAEDENLEFKVEKSNFFKKISKNLILKPSKTKFMPQFTLQHRLEDTISLFSRLFLTRFRLTKLGFDIALPRVDKLMELAQKDDNAEDFHKAYTALCCQKISGLAFLHAVTMFGMVPEERWNEEELFQRILKDLNSSNQVDAKRGISFMSRRPFSDMYNDIRQSEGSYKAFFNESYLSGDNQNFLDRNIPKRLHLASYGQQFFENENVRNLNCFLPFFEPEFEGGDNGHALNLWSQLLRRGILTTDMIRRLKPEKQSRWQEIGEVWNDKKFFDETLNSVEKPINRYKIDLSDQKVSVALDEGPSSRSDTLSPPWFLEPGDAMGKVRGLKKKDIEKYGEAIVEVRCAKDPANASGLGSPGEDFLSKPSEITRHAENLMDFMYNFSKEEDTIEAIRLSMNLGKKGNL